MKLGLSIGYSGAELRLPVDKVLLAERLGFDSVWTAEAYGSDAITPLAYLAALTKRIRLGTGIMANVKLTAEIADGWLPLGFVPRLMPMLRPWLEEGFRRAGTGKGFADFEIQARAEVAITDDVRGVLARMKPRVALYVGGMGHRDKNFHKEMMIRRGFGDAAQRIQELYLAKRKDEAVAAVPDEFCDEMSLVGPVARIRERYRAWAECGITGLTIVTEQPEAMELMASLAGPARSERCLDHRR